MPERLGREFELADRLGQGDEDGMSGPAGIAGVQLALPLIEQLEGTRRVTGFVGQVVGPPAVGVNIVEVLAERAGEKPRDDGEVLVVTAGQARAVAPGIPRRQ